MAAYKLNIGLVRQCPKPADVVNKLKGFGLPPEQEYGILECADSPAGVKATLVNGRFKGICRLNRDKHELADEKVESFTAIPFILSMADKTVKVFAGGARVLKLLADKLAEICGEAFEFEPIPLDPVQVAITLNTAVEDLKLLGVAVDKYAHDSQTEGPYVPKFQSTQHGLDFIGDPKRSPNVSAVAVWWKGAIKKVRVKLVRTAAFAYSCDPDEQQAVETKLVALAVSPSAIKPRDAGPLFPGSGKKSVKKSAGKPQAAKKPRKK
jgi:hypothetical protein